MQDQLIPATPQTPLGAALATIEAAQQATQQRRQATASRRTHKQVSVALPADLLAQIDARASATASTRADTIKTMLAYWLALEAGSQQAHREFMEQRGALASTPALAV